MTKLKVIIIFFFLLSYFLLPKQVFAIEDPLKVPNNKFGIHILFPDEINDAARLVNSNGGDWGYVTIPIQAGDKDLLKWQNFMDSARQKHVIPIIRLASEGDYFNTSVWRKPTEYDVLDFANFLNSLTWPTINRYVVVFNEVNRGDEWEGSPNPKEYARILSYAVDIFKERSQDFFILSSGLDNGCANVYGKYINEYDFMRQMSAFNNVFSKVDGLASHSYPNPGFSKPPTTLGTMSIASFRYEKNLAKTLGGKDLPVFITETGWSSNSVSSDIIPQYLRTAYNLIWNDENIVAVTPFLLKAGSPFDMFSFTNIDGSENENQKAVKEIAKIPGKPQLSVDNESFLAKKMEQNEEKIVDFSKVTNEIIQPAITVPKSVMTTIKWMLKI
ncbi:MAG: hypothetical protein ABH816_03150 [Candidatus Levyibacteriota bacterium]